MHHIVRTRSQHFVSSPRKTASPLIAKHTLYPGRHPPKRRRLGSQAFVISRLPESDLGSGSDSDDSVELIERDDGRSRAEGSRTRRMAHGPLSSEAGQQTVNRLPDTRLGRRLNGRKSTTIGVIQKAKGKGKAREGMDVFGHGSAIDDDEESSSSPKKRKRSRRDPDSEDDSGSWIEMDEAEEEPEFIVESDQHLIDSAPAYALHRLRKAELIRLWKVAGMWAQDDTEITSVDDESDAGMGKKELVDGLIAARKGTDRLISPLPSSRRTRRSSTLSSAYTTTDTSNAEESAPSRLTPRRLRRQSQPRKLTPARRSQHAKSRSGPGARRSLVNGHTPMERNEAESEDDEVTPLAHRLRSRSQVDNLGHEASSEVDADDEENEDETEIGTVTIEDGDEDDDVDSPLPTRRLRSTDKMINSDISMSQLSSKSVNRSLPARGAKKKAIQALKGGESDTEMEMEVDNDHTTAIEDDQDPPGRRLTRRTSRISPPVGNANHTGAPDSDLTLTPIASPETEQEVLETPAPIHTTRSGKAFGVMQSRKKRLRQEARDDPDMDVDEEDNEEDDDDEDETDDDESFAVVASLTRLLRDELVQMCEARGIEVGGTKPQLAKALIHWRDEENGADIRSNPSSQATAKPGSSLRQSQSKKSKSNKIIHAIGSTVHVPGKPTPVLLRDHIHAEDPATPPHSDDSKPINSEAELNLDLSELGLEDSIINPQQLIKLEKIGSGGFKDVFVGKLRGRKVAISEFREHLSEMDIRELKLLAEFSHPNIVKFRGICIPEDSTHVPCMLRNVPCPTLRRLLNLMLDIARGLEYLHTRKPSIIHRDCKSSNILINRQGQAKVGDFGLARVKNSTRSMIRSLVGTVNWQAPELWHPHPRYDYKVDVFSAAMVYWEMMAGWIGDKKYPWEGHNEHYIYDAVGAKHRRPSIAGLRKHWGDEPVNLMERMWHQDPAERPTMTDVVADLESLLAEC
ncbi:TKL protein kinase [Kwoniella heveanensis BCC8398]|uniref:TKL protein kinase n=1 Tax=Kwoniella heveanensis BCC8398 TaxID=1296120 RepID=A0A1B9GJV5_9TREE|nr:TKL protein kinase [Kwoniella heveanensis BCC8398]